MTELRHGYTLADIHTLALKAAANNYTMAADHSDLYYAAWSAIIDHLYAAEHWPPQHDLAREGKGAIWRLVNDHRKTYGYHNKEWQNGIASGPRFVTYWYTPTHPSHEDRIIDNIAVQQVFDALPERLQRAILAAAAHDGDYHAAAEALGLRVATYNMYLNEARKACAQLWVEGETPHRRHGTFNRRRHRGDVAPCGTTSAARRHRSRGERMCELCAPMEREYDRQRKQRRKEAA